MAAPVLVVEYTTDNPDDTTPTWTDVTDLVRAFSTNRGRDSELSTVEAGTATITLDNRDRTFDPTVDTSLRPMNRWRISAVIDSGTEEIFVGYAESYDQQWPAVGKDAVTVVTCVDEFKLLALDALPTTDPPSDSYQDLVLFDNPSNYWALLGPNWGAAAVGENLGLENSIATVTGLGAIVGQTNPGFIYNFGTGYALSGQLQFGSGLDPGVLGEFTIEAWLSIDTAPSATETLIRSPLGIPSATYIWRLRLNTSRQVILQAKNSGGTEHTVTSTTALTSSSVGASMVWYHVVGTISDGELRLYIDSVEEASTAWTGVFEQMEGGGTGSVFIIGNEGNDIGSRVRSFDEVAVYRGVGLEAERIEAHYTAGRERGFVRQQEPGDRIEDVLDAVGSVASRNVQTGTNNMTGAYMSGQPPLTEMRQAELAESVDAVLFIAKDGTVTFLADGHRSSSPYDTVQATFTDDGTGLPYQDVDIDYSDSFLYNDWVVTRTNGTSTTASDATSILRFFKRARSITDLPIIDAADQTAIAAAMLAKYKDPFERVTGLNTLATEEVAEAVLPLDIGARVRVLRHPPGQEFLYPATDLFPAADLYPLSGPVDQESFIQRIAVDGVPGRPWNITLGVSPL